MSYLLAGAQQKQGRREVSDGNGTPLGCDGVQWREEERPSPHPPHTVLCVQLSGGPAGGVHEPDAPVSLAQDEGHCLAVHPQHQRALVVLRVVLQAVGMNGGNERCRKGRRSPAISVP